MPRFTEYDESTWTRSADIYDVMNASRGKSYADETATLINLIDERVDAAGRLLDVACGTGLHLAHLRDRFEVAGVEPHPRFREIARERLSGIAVHDGDMRTFDLGDRFDVVTCLFSAIGYMHTIDDLAAACARMSAHLAPGGLLVVEPWFDPETWIDGLVIAEAATGDGVAVTRLSHSRREGHVSCFDFHYTVGRGPVLEPHSTDGEPFPTDHPPGDVEQWIEPHRLALWTDDEYRAAMERVGLAVEHDRHGLAGRGLYLGRRTD